MGMMFLLCLVAVVLPASFGQGRDKTWIVTTIENEPFLTKKKGGTGNDRFEGFIPDLMEKVANVLDINYELRLVRDGYFGGKLPDGTWNGMIGELMRDEADIAAAPLTITSERESAVDFSKPFMATGIQPYIGLEKSDSTYFTKIFVFIKPFHWLSWILLLSLALVFLIAMLLVRRFNPYEKEAREKRHEHDPNYPCGLHLTGCCIPVSSHGGRAIKFFCWLFLIFIIILYASLLPRYLPVGGANIYTKPIDSLDEATKYGNDMKFFALGNGSTFQFFKTSKVALHERIYSKIKTVKSMEQGLKEAQEGGIFMAESTFMDHLLQRRPCPKIAPLGEQMNANGYGLATSPGSQLKYRLNLAILELKEAGDIQSLYKKWWFDKGECGTDDKQIKKPDEKDETVPLDISWLIWLGVYTGAALLIVLIINLIEGCTYKGEGSSSGEKPDEETGLQEEEEKEEKDEKGGEE